MRNTFKTFTRLQSQDPAEYIKSAILVSKEAPQKSSKEISTGPNLHCKSEFSFLRMFIDLAFTIWPLAKGIFEFCRQSEFIGISISIDGRGVYKGSRNLYQYLNHIVDSFVKTLFAGQTQFAAKLS